MIELMTESERGAIIKDARMIGANWNYPEQTRTYGQPN